jgi:hypothetical protein
VEPRRGSKTTFAVRKVKGRRWIPVIRQATAMRHRDRDASPAGPRVLEDRGKASLLSPPGHRDRAGGLVLNDVETNRYPA